MDKMMTLSILTMLQLINDKKVPLDKYFISDNALLHKFVRKDDKLLHPVVVPVTLNKYILHQVNFVLGYNATARTSSCLK